MSSHEISSHVIDVFFGIGSLCHTKETKFNGVIRKSGHGKQKA